MNSSSHTSSVELGRRRFMQRAACAAAAMTVPGMSAAAIKKNHPARHLAFENLHTGEKLAVTYFEHGHYNYGALKELNHVLRDHRSGDSFAMDPSLYDLLFALQRKLHVNKPIQIISGYRSPATNAMLQKRSSGVATRSLHMLGMAIDIRMERVNCRHIRNAAVSLQKGGVGYYPESNFVHVDTGRVRFW